MSRFYCLAKFIAGGRETKSAEQGDQSLGTALSERAKKTCEILKEVNL
jgi:hypothetical protein